MSTWGRGRFLEGAARVGRACGRAGADLAARGRGRGRGWSYLEPKSSLFWLDGLKQMHHGLFRDAPFVLSLSKAISFVLSQFQAQFFIDVISHEDIELVFD